MVYVHTTRLPGFTLPQGAGLSLCVLARVHQLGTSLASARVRLFI